MHRRTTVMAITEGTPAMETAIMIVMEVAKIAAEMAVTHQIVVDTDSATPTAQMTPMGPATAVEAVKVIITIETITTEGETMEMAWATMANTINLDSPIKTADRAATTARRMITVAVDLTVEMVITAAAVTITAMVATGVSPIWLTEIKTITETTRIMVTTTMETIMVKGV